MLLRALVAAVARSSGEPTPRSDTATEAVELDGTFLNHRQSEFSTPRSHSQFDTQWTLLRIQRSADRLADRFRSEVNGRSLEDRVPAVTGVLHLIGGFAEWHRTDDSFEILDYNCVFARLMPETQSGCEWHVRLLTRLLQWPVRHELVVSGRVKCCRYIIDPNPSPSEEGHQP